HSSASVLYTLCLHDALPILEPHGGCRRSGSDRHRCEPGVDRGNRGSVRTTEADRCARDGGVGQRCYATAACSPGPPPPDDGSGSDRKSTRLNSSHVKISYAV